MKHHDKAVRRREARREDFERSRANRGSSANLDGYRRPGSLNRHKSFSPRKKR